MCFKAQLIVGISTISERNNSFRAKLLAISPTTFDESLIIKNQFFFFFLPLDIRILEKSCDT